MKLCYGLRIKLFFQEWGHARIYDRLTSMCAPVRFTGSNFRKETAQEKLERLKQLMKQRKESL